MERVRPAISRWMSLTSPSPHAETKACSPGLSEVAALRDEDLVDRVRIGHQEGRKRAEAERHDAAILGRDAGHEPERIARIGREVAEERQGPGRRSETSTHGFC